MIELVQTRNGNPFRTRKSSQWMKKKTVDHSADNIHEEETQGS